MSDEARTPGRYVRVIRQDVRSMHAYASQPSEGLVKLEYAGLNFIDVYMRSGKYARSQTYATPLPMTLGMEGAGTVTERFRRVNFGKLEIQLTVDDPKAYTKPWTTTLNQFVFADTELLDYICVENERDVQHLSGK